MAYKVKLNIFEGPLDLLLFLIKKEKVEIYDIPIATVTEQYLEYLELMKMLDLDIAGEFLVMAATLMHIKSKMLLPPDETEAEEEQEMEDPREELVKRLLEYKKYKDAADKLTGMKEKHREIFLRKGATDGDKIVTYGENQYFEASLFDLITAFQKVLKDVPKDSFHKVVKDKVSVGDKIHSIYHLLAERSKAKFSELFQDADNKDEVIVTFLAILELIKAREILVIQQEAFKEIEIIRNPEVAKNS